MRYVELRDVAGYGDYDVSLMPAGWFVRCVYLIDDGICLSSELDIPQGADGASCGGRPMSSIEIDDAVLGLFEGDEEQACRAKVSIRTPYELRSAEYAGFHGEMDIIDVH